MKYRFYGWECADAAPISSDYVQIVNPRELYDHLSELWCAATCAPRLRETWSEENRTLGQCSITAFLVQDIFGGKVFGILRPGGNYHCYNVIGESVFDLTSEQFGGEVLCYENNPEQFREVHFAKEEKRLRYEQLKALLRARLGISDPTSPAGSPGAMRIRHATPADLPAMEELYEQSRTFMAENGNPTQWGTTDPPVSLLQQDIEQGCSYVCEADGAVIAAFMFFIGPEPTYREIDGAWKNDLPYGVMHRMASGGGHRGAGTFCMNWCWEQCWNLRVDTHRNNLPMQGLFRKLGFEYCGVIHVADGSERLAYQKTRDDRSCSEY